MFPQSNEISTSNGHIFNSPQKMLIELEYPPPPINLQIRENTNVKKESQGLALDKFCTVFSQNIKISKEKGTEPLNLKECVLKIKNNEHFNKDVQKYFRLYCNEVGAKFRYPLPKEIENTFDRLNKRKITQFKSKKIKKTFARKKENLSWKKAETLFFLWVLSYYSVASKKKVDDYAHEDWLEIAKILPRTTSNFLQVKWFSMKKSKAQIEPWTKEEEELLSKIMANHEKHKRIKWSKVSEEFNFSSSQKTIRLPKHCREKWFNYLKPNLKKGDWTLSEDLFILEQVLANGTKWASISRNLFCRNENSVKNRYFTLLGLHALSRRKSKVSHHSISEKLKAKIAELKENLLTQPKAENLKNLQESSVNFTANFIESIAKPAKNKNSVRFYEEEIGESQRKMDFSMETSIHNLQESIQLTRNSKRDFSPLKKSGLYECSFRMNAGNNLVVDGLSRPPTLHPMIFSETTLGQLKRDEGMELESSKALNESPCSKKSMTFYPNKRSSLMKIIKEPAWNTTHEKDEFLNTNSYNQENNVNLSSSSISLDEIHVMNSKSMLEKSNITGSSLSYKENKFLISTIINLKSEGSKISSLESALSKDWRKVRDRLENEYEEEHQQ